MLRWYWAIWLVIGFGVPETLAIVSRKFGNTLSDTVWTWFNVLPGQTIWQWSIAHLILAVIMLWLSFHLVFRMYTSFRG